MMIEEYVVVSNSQGAAMRVLRSHSFTSVLTPTSVVLPKMEWQRIDGNMRKQWGAQTADGKEWRKQIAKAAVSGYWLRGMPAKQTYRFSKVPHKKAGAIHVSEAVYAEIRDTFEPWLENVQSQWGWSEGKIIPSAWQGADEPTQEDMKYYAQLLKRHDFSSIIEEDSGYKHILAVARRCDPGHFWLDAEKEKDSK